MDDSMDRWVDIYMVNYVMTSMAWRRGNVFNTLNEKRQKKNLNTKPAERGSGVKCTRASFAMHLL